MKLARIIHSNITNHAKFVFSEGIYIKNAANTYIFILISRHSNDSWKLESLSDSLDSEPVVNDKGNNKSRELP